jgi:hypothetical protein
MKKLKKAADNTVKILELRDWRETGLYMLSTEN